MPKGTQQTHYREVMQGNARAWIADTGRPATGGTYRATVARALKADPIFADDVYAESTLYLHGIKSLVRGNRKTGLDVTLGDTDACKRSAQCDPRPLANGKLTEGCYAAGPGKPEFVDPNAYRANQARQLAVLRVYWTRSR